MQDGTFSRPVIFFARELDSSVQHVELTTVHEGLRALSRGMEGFRLDCPESHLAFHTLSRAILDHGCGPHGNRLISRESHPRACRKGRSQPHRADSALVTEGSSPHQRRPRRSVHERLDAQARGVP
jgi:hypothetical protein